MKNGVKILILDGNNIKKVQENNHLQEDKQRKIVFDFKGVFANSLLLEQLRKLGLEEKLGKTRDIIGLEFTHKYTSLNAKEKLEDIAKLKEDSSEELIKIKMELDKLETQKAELQGDKKLSELDEETKAQVKAVIAKIKEHKARRKEINDEIKSKKQEISDTDILNKKEIRQDLYTNGFTLDFTDKDGNITTKKYVFWFRSPSKCRVGEAVFINEKLFDAINKWQTMGIELSEDKAGNVKLVEMEAYKSLSASAIENTFTLNPGNILVVNDLDSIAEYNCVLVKVNEYGETYVENSNYKLKNILFDGQALLDKSVFPKRYQNKGMIVGRQRYFKACMFNTNIQLFMQDMCKEHGWDYETKTVKDKYGNDIKIKDVLCITTHKAMKWEIFFDNKAEGFNTWQKAVMEDDCMFGICKTTHETKYSKVGLQRMSYQQINSLPIAKDDIEQLIQPSIDYINNMKSDNNIENFIQYLEATADNTNENDMLIDLYRQNNKFKNSYLFTTRKKHKFEKLKNGIKAGKLFCHGDNLTLCGNPYTLLLHSVGAVPNTNNVVADNYEDITLPVIDKTCVAVYTKRFADGEELASFRNPHNAPNNIGYNKNFISDKMDKYFNFDDNIMAVNCIRTNEQDAKNGEDFDSDFNLVTNDSVIVKSAKIATTDYATIVNLIPQSGKTYKNSMEDLAQIDDGLGKAKNEIGISSNLAQIALSWYWELKNKGKKEDMEKLKGFVAILAVLAQCSIDGSKRQYSVDVSKEINRIRKEIKAIIGQDNILPTFWQYTNETIKGMNKIEKKEAIANLVDCACPMNLIQGYVNNIKTDSKPTRVSDIEFVLDINGTKDSKMYETIVEATKTYVTETKRLYAELEKALTDTNKENINKQLSIKQDDLLKVYSKVNLGLNSKNKKAQKTMQMLVKSCLDKDGKNKDYKLIMLKTLHKTHKTAFLSVFKR